MPGHKDIQGNELADKQAREAAAEMSVVDPKEYPITIDKRKAVTEINPLVPYVSYMIHDIFYKQR